MSDKTTPSNDNKASADMSIGDFKTQVGNDNNLLAEIDRYQLISELGRGGFGAVFLAKDTISHQLVALKTLPPELNHSPEELEAVRDNFNLVTNLNHPNIAAAKHLHKVNLVTNCSPGIHIEANEYLLVLEYAQGTTLSKWKRQFPGQKVPFEKVINIGLQVAEALDYAHSRKIIHRDIKPGNIIIDNDERIKVLDFGLAAEIRSSMTRVSNEAGSKSGTRPYMPPEQLLGKKQDHSTDQYALAVMCYELIGGEVPFRGVFETGDLPLITNVVTQNSPENLAELNKKQNLALMRGLHKDRLARYQYCGDLLEALSLGKVKTKRKKRQEKNRSSHYIIIAIIALATIGFVSHSYYQNREVEQKKALEAKQKIQSQQQEAQRLQELDIKKQKKIKALLNEATNHFKQKDFSHCSQVISDLLNLDPNNREALLIKNELQEQLGLKEAIPSRSKAIIMKKEIEPQRETFRTKMRQADVLFENAEGFFNAKDYATAIESYQQYSALGESILTLAQERQDYLGKAKKVTKELFSGNPEPAKLPKAEKDLWQSSRSAFKNMNFRKASNDIEQMEKLHKQLLLQQKLESAYNEKLKTIKIIKAQALSEHADRLSRNLWESAEKNLNQAEELASRFLYPEAEKNLDQAEKLFQNSARESSLIRKKESAQTTYLEATEKATHFLNNAQNLQKNNRKKAALKLFEAIEVLNISTDHLSQKERQKLTELKSEIQKFSALFSFTPKEGQIWTSSSLDLRLLPIAPNQFIMGSPTSENQRDQDELQHSQAINSHYWMAELELSQKSYFVITGTNPSFFKGEELPVENITRREALLFCQKLTAKEHKEGNLSPNFIYTLPTEDQWEFACRAGTTTPFSYGENLSSKQANFNGSFPYGKANKGSFKGQTIKPGSYAPNAWGLYDMHGNVWEWCRDNYRDYSQAIPEAHYLIRGGSWYSYGLSCRSANRNKVRNNTQNKFIGFRIVCIAKPKYL